jgi:hypothetical protein
MLHRLAGLAHTKMQSVFGRGSREDSIGLHRYVLLKNSIASSYAPPQHTPESEPAAHEYDEQDMFTFPLLDGDDASAPLGGASESEWLDSLLEELGDEDDEIEEDALSVDEPSPSTSPEASYTPFPSPASSAVSLVTPGTLFCAPSSQPIPVPYPIPYPPLVRTAYADEFDDLPVPDAIEDTSDDESDASATPSSAASSLASLIEAHRAATLHQRFRLPPPRIVVGSTDDPLCFPYDAPFDPLPPASIEEPHNIQQGGLYTAPRYAYQEC